MAKELTALEISGFIAKLKTYPYLVSVGETVLAPLDSPPAVERDSATSDVTLYETSGDTEASFLTKNDVKLTISTRAVDAAIGLLDSLKVGDNMMDSTRKKTITLVPITGDEGEKTITFTDAYLDASGSYEPKEGRAPNVVQLSFICKANKETGKPFTYA